MGRKMISLLLWAVGLTSLGALLTSQIFLTGDTPQYVSMAQGQIAEAPFAYRIAVPTLVRLLPWSIPYNFFIITYISHICLLCILFFVFEHVTKSYKISIFTVICFSLSYTFLFYMSEFGRVDPLYHVFFAIALLCILKHRYIPALIVITLGIFVKETVLLLLPILVINFIQQNRRFIQYMYAIPLALIPVCCYLLIHHFTPAISGVFSIHNLSDLILLWRFIWSINIESYGLGIRIIREIIRSYGFLWVLALIGLPLLDQRLRWICGYLLITALLLCSITTDWARMMISVFPAIFLPIAMFIQQRWSVIQQRQIAIPLLLLCLSQTLLALAPIALLPGQQRLFIIGATILVTLIGGVGATRILRLDKVST